MVWTKCREILAERQGGGGQVDHGRLGMKLYKVILVLNIQGDLAEDGVQLKFAMSNLSNPCMENI